MHCECFEEVTIKEEFYIEDNKANFQTLVENSGIQNEITYIKRDEYCSSSFIAEELKSRRYDLDGEVTVKLELQEFYSKPIEYNHCDFQTSDTSDCSSFSFKAEESTVKLEPQESNAADFNLHNHLIEPTADKIRDSAYDDNPECSSKESRDLKKIHPKTYILEGSQPDAKKFSCEQCDYKTKWKHHFKNHMIHHKPNSKKFSCGQCNYTTRLKDNFKKHMLCHPKNEKFICDEPDYKTCILKTHMMEPHPPESRILFCNQCDFKTMWSLNLKSHMICHQSDGKKFSCERCDYKTKWKCALKSHMIRHQPDSKIFNCDKCNYETKWKHALKIHMTGHQPESKKFGCQQCAYKTNRKDCLKTHVTKHH